ncbi:MAG: glycosyltransferase [Myxococcota bacterium]
MNLIFLNSIPIWGGGERWTLDAAEAFARRGHQVRVIAARRGVLRERVARAGLPHLDLPDSFWSRLRFPARLRRELRSDGPDILVALTGRDLRLAARLRVDPRATRLVFARQLDRPLRGGPLRRYGFREVDLVIANSDGTRATLARSLPWLPDHRLVRVYNAFDRERFLRYPPREVRSELGIPERALVVGILARLVEQKAHRVLLRAMLQVRAALPAAMLMVVGDGELAEALRANAREIGLEEACRFTGWVDPVQPYYASCDIIAIPSRFEGFCFAAVEAQAMGKPVVASRASSLPEVLADGESAFLVPVGDSTALADRIIQLGREPALRQRMGQAGRRFIDKFSGARIHAQLERLFEDLRLQSGARG